MRSPSSVRLRGIIFISFIALLLVSPCQAGQPFAIPQGVEYLPDLVYSTPNKGNPLELDLARPAKGKGPFPAVVVVHGGGWSISTRKLCVPITLTLAERGFIAVSISYRFATSAAFPAQLHDARTAVRWLRANAEKYQVDPNRIAALGYSAGGHLACLLGLGAEAKAFAEKGPRARHSCKVQAVVSYYGVSDMKRLYDYYEKGKSPFPFGNLPLSFLNTLLGGTPAEMPGRYREASPITHAGKHAPPLLLLHGTADTVVLPEHSSLLAAELKKHRAPVELVLIEGAGHNFGSGWGGKYGDQADAAALRFLEKHLGKQRK